MNGQFLRIPIATQIYINLLLCQLRWKHSNVIWQKIPSISPKRFQILLQHSESICLIFCTFPFFIQYHCLTSPFWMFQHYFGYFPSISTWNWRICKSIFMRLLGYFDCLGYYIKVKSPNRDHFDVFLYLTTSSIRFPVTHQFSNIKTNRVSLIGNRMGFVFMSRIWILELFSDQNNWFNIEIQPNAIGLLFAKSIFETICMWGTCSSETGI